MAVAERVTARVKVGKLQLQAEDSNTRLRQAYESLGHCLHRACTAPSQEAFPADEVLQFCDRIRTEQQTLLAIRERLASQYDEVLGVPLLRLKEDLKDGMGMVERVTISPASQADGKRLGDLALPEGVQFVVLRRGEALIFPAAESVLRAGDQVTVIGKRSVVPNALQLLRT